MDHEPNPSDPRSPAPRRIPRPEPGHLDVPGIVESFAENMMYAVAKDEFTAAELDMYHARLRGPGPPHGTLVSDARRLLPLGR
jgi:hypothetical protein